MPHMVLSAEELDSQFPPMVVPPEDLEVDLHEDEPLEELGRSIARSLDEAVQLQGRKRHHDESPAKNSPTGLP